MKVDKIEDSFNVINAREKPLAAYLFTNDEMLKGEFVESVSAGGLSINETTLHVSVLPRVAIHAKAFCTLEQMPIILRVAILLYF